jgi:hypothetical protein
MTLLEKLACGNIAETEKESLFMHLMNNYKLFENMSAREIEETVIKWRQNGYRDMSDKDF